MPLGVVVPIRFGAGGHQHGLQGDAPEPISALTNLLKTHGYGLSFALRLRQFFILITWLFSVRRSMSAAVR